MKNPIADVLHCEPLPAVGQRQEGAGGEAAAEEEVVEEVQSSKIGGISCQ